jgi:hypothetical protein
MGWFIEPRATLPLWILLLSLDTLIESFAVTRGKGDARLSPSPPT